MPLDDFHTVIKEALMEGNRRLSARSSLLDAVLQVATGGWDPSDTDTINEASVKEAYDTILALTRKNFGTFVHFYRKEIKNPLLGSGERGTFSTGVPPFLEAAQQIVSENARPRLTKLLRLHLGEALNASPTALEQTSDTNLTGTS
ncbi:hypothetical protein [Diaphorobacter aerolatus]|uniref:Uncharacterized protein n=2 Tax=Comamonadaceae TaxID=80864 RepID=A0A7H0GPG1_9BURK|nr:hypothetical protein [Diaphorobacter aerolatus]QNP50177.1 hypothetical protein H9K75_10365 [Diaphorobacter aerolatus]